MKTIHEKSPCCGVQIQRFGGRRRRCAGCGKTWTVWKRKRGRSKHRPSTTVLLKYFRHQYGSIRQYALSRQMKPRKIHARIQQTVRTYITHTPWPEIPSGPLVVIADALWQPVGLDMYTIYFILFRSQYGTQAVVSKPWVALGTESHAKGWHDAFAQVPMEVQKRIVALVCDGIPELDHLAREQGWVLQRCHFHLLARFESYRSTGQKSFQRKRNQLIKQWLTTVLISSNPDQLHTALDNLNLTQQALPASKTFKSLLTGFLKHSAEYRSYLTSPDLHLPTTSNTAECLIGQVRRLQHQARGFRNLESFLLWLEAYLKYKRSIACRGQKDQQN